jgi:hypothetical protein
MGEELCRFCIGSGRDPGKNGLCRICNGDRFLMIPDGYVLCPVCIGSSKDPFKKRQFILPEPCPKCKGIGKIPPLSLQKDESGLSILCVSGMEPFTDYVKISEIFQNLSGDIDICDPYIGEESLLLLGKIPKDRKLRFLIGRNATVPPSLSKFKKEFHSFNFKRHINDDFHDRYIIDDNLLIILGHGLKDIGQKKESFLIKIQRSLIIDTVHFLEMKFNERWTIAKEL